jgi:Rrf2 family protein
MQLKRQTIYAIRILMYLARHKSASRNEMSDALGINEFYLPKIIKPLREKKWIISLTGRVGGFELVEKPENITLLEIIEVMEGGVNLSNNQDREDEE